MRIPARLRATASLLLVTALAACAGPTTTTAPGDGAPEAAGTVRFALAADPQTLDPLFAHVDANSVEQQVARLAFEPFIDVDERGTPVPVLLDRIPTVENGGLSRDGRVITYHLRREREVAGRRAGERARRGVDARTRSSTTATRSARGPATTASRGPRRSTPSRCG